MPDPVVLPVTPPAWHTGLDAELLGHIQNRGWQEKTAAEVAVEAARAHREAERHIGIPANQLLRLPKDATDEAGWKAVWQRLGMPADAKDYDFKTIKTAAGTEIDAGLDALMREVATTAHLPKDTAPRVADLVVKHLDAREAAAKTEADAALAAERIALDKSWGANKTANLLAAQQGAKAMGLDPEVVSALEKATGYAKTMEALRQVGVKIGEDKFITGGGPAGGPMTVEQAAAKKADLLATPDFAKRFLAAEPAAVREMTALDTMITQAQMGL